MPTLTYLKERYKLMPTTKESVTSANVKAPSSTTAKPSTPQPQAPAKVESPKPQVATSKQEVDKASAAKHLAEVKAYLLSFDGRPGFNPHLLLGGQVANAERALAQENPLTKTTFDAIMTLSKTEPKI